MKLSMRFQFLQIPKTGQTHKQLQHYLYFRQYNKMLVCISFHETKCSFTALVNFCFLLYYCFVVVEELDYFDSHPCWTMARGLAKVVSNWIVHPATGLNRLCMLKRWSLPVWLLVYTHKIAIAAPWSCPSCHSFYFPGHEVSQDLSRHLVIRFIPDVHLH